MRIEGSIPLWLAARRLLIERVDTFFSMLQRADADPGTEVIHDLRVASRRLREALSLFAPCYPEKEISRLRKQVRRVTGALGELRNADEAFLFLKGLSRRLEAPGRDFLAAPLARCRLRRRQERESLHPVLATWLDGAHAERFRRAARRPLLFTDNPRNPAFLSAGEFALAALDLQSTEIPQLLPAALREAEIASQHRLRIAVKHFRYRSEILSPLLGSGFRPLHDKLKAYQEELGKMHDLDVFAALLAEENPGPGREETLAAVAAERREHFQRFVALNADAPLPDVGERLRRLL